MALAVSAGADRLELCHDLNTGGLTPSIDWLAAVREATTLPLMVMVRPRADRDFRAAPGEVATMIRSFDELREAGADGFVFGILDTGGGFDLGALDELMAAARGMPVTFHRAFDRVSDPMAGAEALVAHGVTRVLTAGGPGSALEGLAVLSTLTRQMGTRLTILAGGGVRAGHVTQLVAEGGLTEVHARASAIPDLIRALT